MSGWLLDPFSGDIAQRALVEVVAVGLACGPLGVWILLYRQSYAAESISHGMLPGLVVAVLAGVPLVLGAGAGVLLAAAGIALAARDERLGGDVGVAVTVTGLFGLGALLALSPEVPPKLSDLLFGDLLGVTATDLLVAGALVLVLLAALAAAHRPLTVAGFDRGAAGSLGVRVARVDLALLVLLGVATVAAVQGLGNLLVVALVLAPAAAALNLAGRLPAALAMSAGLAALAGVGGLIASYHLQVAAGAAVALAAVGLFLLSACATTTR
jgi:ABC-type Mn2+/Zn2+ transport system permease subunit